MQQHKHIDKNKIFIYGVSAGAFMSVAMISNYPDVFEAAAIFAGGAYKTLKVVINNKDSLELKKELINYVKEQNPEYDGKYAKLIIVQGEKDVIAPPKHAERLIYQWTGINNCDSKPYNTITNYLDFDFLTCYEYCNNNNYPLVKYITVKKTGHTLLVKPGNKINEGGKTSTFSINKGFHSTFFIAKEFNLVSED
jgi:poly(3-hydroxybutyrate) depolymerase